MPSALPDFGTNVKNGHEERIKDREQTEDRTERCREEREQRREGAGWSSDEGGAWRPHCCLTNVGGGGCKGQFKAINLISASSTLILDTSNSTIN